MTKHALKFFQAYIQEMIEIGGPNLPKSISSRLGARLAKLYKTRGISGIENGLRVSYQVLKTKPRITKLNENTLHVTMKYSKKFCPIGGKFKDNPEYAEIVQDSICFPYTYGFLNEMDPNYKYQGTIKECILKSDNNICEYLLKFEEKGNGLD